MAQRLATCPTLGCEAACQVAKAPPFSPPQCPPYLSISLTPSSSQRHLTSGPKQCLASSLPRRQSRPSSWLPLAAFQASPSLTFCLQRRSVHHGWAIRKQGHTVRAASSSVEPESETQAKGATAIVHPTALVHSDAVLGEGVEVGAFCTVGSMVRLGDGCKLHPGCHVQGDTKLGDHCTLLSGAIVGSDLPGHTRLGSHNRIGHHSVLGIQCQDMKYKEGSECFLVIGSHNDIREHAQIHRSSKPDDCTVIGNHNLIMGGCHIAHDCKIGDRNILANNTLLAGHVVLHQFIHTGGAVAVHQFCHIDSYAFVAGGAMVTRDVPLYTMVSGDRAELRGLNVEGLRRCGFSTQEVQDIRLAYQKLFLSSEEFSGFEERLATLEESDLGQAPRVQALLHSIKGSFNENRRGICKFRHWSLAD